jgi:hypothetical protein
MPFIELPEKAEQRSRARNEEVYGPVTIAEVPEDFGVRDTPIFFYNTGPMEFSEPRYPNHPHMLIRACPPGTPYIMARGSITHPFRELREDQNGQKFTILTNGYREATKMMNPMNPTIDQSWHDAGAFNENGNLNRFGVFWSTHNPPLEEELAVAKQRMEETYRKELEIMVAIEAKEGPDGARARANDISRAAANYFGQSYSWHRMDLVPKDVNVGKVDCWACGEQIRPKALLCVHCGAPADEEKREKWLEQKFAEKRAPGRPANA